MLTDTTDDLVLDVLEGRSDAALLRSDAINNIQHRGIVNASDFKLTEAVSLFAQAHEFCTTYGTPLTVAGR